MAHYHFVIAVDGKIHKCYLGEDRRVYILDDNGQQRTVSAPTSMISVEEAKETAKIMIEALERDKQQKT